MRAARRLLESPGLQRRGCRTRTPDRSLRPRTPGGWLLGPALPHCVTSQTLSPGGGASTRTLPEAGLPGSARSPRGGAAPNWVYGKAGGPREAVAGVEEGGLTGEEGQPRWLKPLPRLEPGRLRGGGETPILQLGGPIPAGCWRAARPGACPDCYRMTPQREAGCCGAGSSHLAARPGFEVSQAQAVATLPGAQQESELRRRRSCARLLQRLPNAQTQRTAQATRLQGPAGLALFPGPGRPPLPHTNN